MKKSLAVVLWLVSGLGAGQSAPSVVLRIAGSPESAITVETLRKAGTKKVAISSERGETVDYKVVPLLDVLENGGLDTKGMPAGRKLAAAIVVATARDGYTAVFSVAELVSRRQDPRVYITGETADGALPEAQRPLRLVAVGESARSAHALSTIEVRLVAENKPGRKS